MRYCIEQAVFTIGDRFDIMDASGTVLYRAEGEIFTFGKKLHVYDVNTGEEVLYIEQELFRFRPHYGITCRGSFIGTLVCEWSFFSREYSMEELGWTVTGDFFGHDYSIFKNGHPVASVGKEWFTFGDCYTVDADDPADGLSALAVTLAIDCIDAQRRN